MMLSLLKRWAIYHIDALRMKELFLTQHDLLTEMCADMLRQRHAGTKRLMPAGFKVYSQGDQDGLIAEIFRRIGTTSRRFVEFGSSDGRVNNTAFLLLQDWTGLWMDAKPECEAGIRRRWGAQMDEGRLVYRRTFITPDNINALLNETGFGADLDLLVIDIDGNDFHVWEALETVAPRVICIEYNSKFPPPVDWVMPRDDAYNWDGSDRFGATLAALERLATRKGYVLVGCSITGVDAFFVRKDLAGGHFAEPFTAQNHYEPPRFFLHLSSGHPSA